MTTTPLEVNSEISRRLEDADSMQLSSGLTHVLKPCPPVRLNLQLGSLGGN